MTHNFSFQAFLEGKAIQATPDMEEFAHEATDMLLKKGKMFGRIIDAGKYGKKYVRIKPKYNKDFKMPTGGANYSSREITIHINPNLSTSYYGLYGLILHELIHMFDPKVTNSKLRDAKWGINSINLQNLNNPEHGYYSHPWEQDAFMVQSANDIARQWRWFYDNDKKEMLKSLTKLKPETNYEKEWYSNPKIWRKYLNTIYDKIK
jgi:hypothetical protein